jgi:hypothetical protein
MDRVAARRAALSGCGADERTSDEVMAFGDARDRAIPEPAPALPLADEAHIEAWRDYEAAARRDGALDELRRRFAQVRFPIEAGMSQHPSYRAATLSGDFAAADAFEPGLRLRRPAEIALEVFPSIAGAIPVLTVSDRNDFVALVQAFTERNEPVDVPPSVGAYIVSGINNWDRIARHRARWDADGGPDRESWADEFRRLAARKDLYQDRLILLSRGPYSGLSAHDVGMADDEWLARSLVIRREHEFTHYFVYRLCGALRLTVLDELLADFVGLVRAFGHYSRELANRFLGIEAYPERRPGGRLEYYVRQAQFTPDALRTLGCLAWRSTGNLEAVARDRAADLASIEGLASVALAIGRLTLEECAADDMPLRVSASVTRAQDG